MNILTKHFFPWEKADELKWKHFMEVLILIKFLGEIGP